MDLHNEVFSNGSLTVEQLPQLSQLQQQSLAPKYAKVRLTITFVLFSVILVLGTIVIFQPFVSLSANFIANIKIFMVIVFWVAVIVFIYIGFADQQKKYALRALDLNYTSGLIFRKTVSQPILRIQHVELKRGPIDRKVGLAKLQVFSAGGAMHTFEIPDLPMEDAESIRQFIISHKDANNG